MALKISSSLKEAAKKTAADMLKMDLMEKSIPEMPLFRLSKVKKSPDGYQIIGEIEEEKTNFFIFQKI